MQVPAGTAKTSVNSVVALMVEPGEDIASAEMPADAGPPPAAAAAPEPAAAAAPAASAPAAAAPAPAAAHGATAGKATTKPLRPSVVQLVHKHHLNVSEIPATGPKGHLLKVGGDHFTVVMRTS